MTAEQLFERTMPEPNSGCWLWAIAFNRGGYGRATQHGRAASAHRAVYEAFVGPIPPGLQIDHLCRNRLCVNPAHLEPVSAKENIRRRGLTGMGARHAAKTTCPRGHLYDKFRSSGARACNTCDLAVARKASRVYHAKKRAARA